MVPELLGIVCVFFLSVICSIPLGKYISKVFLYEYTRLDIVFNRLDRWIITLSGIDATRQMTWKDHVKSLLYINGVWFFLSMAVLMNMSHLPLNPDGNPSMSFDLAFNTSVSFITNTNLQHYSGETGLSYLGQLILMLWQFLSAASGITVCAVVFMAMKETKSEAFGNFYSIFIRSCTRILFPLAIVTAILFLFNGMPMTFEGKDSITTLQGEQQYISRGPVAAFTAIKHLGTNGGGFYGVNSAHPLENPNYFTAIIQMIAQTIIPMGLVFALGYMLKNKKFSRMIFGVMTVGFIILVTPTIISEMQGNPNITAMGIQQTMGNMEGKEIRFGSGLSGYWSIITTVISTGSVNAMHDSFMPLSTMNQLLAMMVNGFYGGCGVGFLNFYIFIILAVFISGLMVGRTPEFLGKKVEAKEIKIAMLIALLHPFLILKGTALATALPDYTTASLSNPGFHGFSQILYEFTSSSANNGSGLEGLGDNTPFWNIACGIVMVLARYLPIIGPIAIAGILANKKYIPESNGTLKTDTPTFGLMIFAVIIIITTLSFFPALTLGPVAEYFSLIK
ncbi:MAG: potassium-transporting ATPase subunit KdpA [Candidatus Kapabacteria bacterium]|nr:potassium-transporting ATPase subunit KdpA [Candidatus Kapabacteria bacterium]